jgi:hypothetical protein
LPAIDRALLDLTVDQDTFEVLYRRRLQLAVAPDRDVHAEGEPAPMDELTPPPPVPAPAQRRITLGSVVGLVLAALTAIDTALLARFRRSGGRL